MVGEFLGDWFGQSIKEKGFIDKIDIVIPVPLHSKKLKKRGYNQVSLFASRLAHHLGAELREDILLKTANSKTQTKKGRIGRWFDNKALFTISEAVKLQGKNVLLVDDIITTGATIEKCALAIQKSQLINLYVASMAVVP